VGGVGGYADSDPNSGGEAREFSLHKIEIHFY